MSDTTEYTYSGYIVTSAPACTQWELLNAVIDIDKFYRKLVDEVRWRVPLLWFEKDEWA